MAVAVPPLLTPLDAAIAEANSVALGVSLDTLMENAGRAVAEEVAARAGPAPRSIAVVAGIGNNGGDGACAAHYLRQWGYAVDLWLVRPVAEVRSSLARHAFERAENEAPLRVGVPSADELRPSDWVVDALLGSGQDGSPRGPVGAAIAAIETAGRPVLSIDLPSGAGTEDAIHPKVTVALTGPKVDPAPSGAGELVVRSIGIPPDALDGTGPGEFLLYPNRGDADPRGRAARLLVIGGGPYTGAPALAALAALRSGAERATVLCPAEAAAAIRGFSPDLVVVPVGGERFTPSEVPELASAIRDPRENAAIIGMGAGADEETEEALRRLLETAPPRLPIVVDADGLRSLSPWPNRPGPVVATPNAGEYQRIFSGRRDDDLRAVRARAAEWGLTLLVKGEVDLMSDGIRGYRNRAHHPAATVGGVGDLLAGVVGGLLAQGLRPLDAARLGSYWVGDAGRRAASDGGYGIIASDVLGQVPAALVDGLRRVRPGATRPAQA